MLRSFLVGKQQSILVLGCKSVSFSTFVRRQDPTNLRLITSSSPLSFKNFNWNGNNNGSTRGSSTGIVYKNQVRFYDPMTKQEEEIEKQRVAGLSAFKKDQELRSLNRQILKLKMLRGINTGDQYTISGRYKIIASEYMFPMMGWYGVCWVGTFGMIWTATALGGIDAMDILAQLDASTGWGLVNRVDPAYGKLGVVIILNELAEPLRLPFVVTTVKPIIDNLFPPKV